ncbi:hypothetical protein EDB87DRAFT_289092 [Lactarius vividus]|nr:hypothetical protein EDB87DRAFT_289092 [Lactarius vividus]
MGPKYSHASILSSSWPAQFSIIFLGYRYSRSAWYPADPAKLETTSTYINFDPCISTEPRRILDLPRSKVCPGIWSRKCTAEPDKDYPQRPVSIMMAWYHSVQRPSFAEVRAYFCSVSRVRFRVGELRPCAAHSGIRVRRNINRVRWIYSRRVPPAVNVKVTRGSPLPALPSTASTRSAHSRQGTMRRCSFRTSHASRGCITRYCWPVLKERARRIAG